MTGIEIIQPSAVLSVFPDFPEDLQVYVAHSNPLYGGFYHDMSFCIVGLIPQSDDPNMALIWGWNTPLVAKHPFIYGRWAHRMIKQALNLYPILVGICYKNQARWVSFLTDTYAPMSYNLLAFSMERSNGSTSPSC